MSPLKVYKVRLMANENFQILEGSPNLVMQVSQGLIYTIVYFTYCNLKKRLKESSDSRCNQCYLFVSVNSLDSMCLSY